MSKLKFIPGRPPGPPKTDYRTIRLDQVLKSLPPAPETADVDDAVNQAVHIIIADHFMWLNDTYGICVVAGWLAELLRWETQEQGKQPVFTDADAKKEYFAQTGGVDSGLNLLDYLKHLRKDGIVLGGKTYKIHAFASIDIKNHEQVKLAVQYFRGAYLGMMVPQSMMDQFDAGQIFDVVAHDGGLKGGHCVYGPAYLKFRVEAVTQVGPVIRTWAKRVQATWAFFDKYFDEGYIVIDADDAQAVNHIDMEALDVLLAEVTNAPPPPDPIPPAPEPPAPPKPGCLGTGLLGIFKRR